MLDGLAREQNVGDIPLPSWLERKRDELPFGRRRNLAGGGKATQKLSERIGFLPSNARGGIARQHTLFQMMRSLKVNGAAKITGFIEGSLPASPTLGPGC